MVLRKLFVLKVNLAKFTSKLPNNRGYSVKTAGTRGKGFKSRNDQKALQSNFGTPDLRRPKHFINHKKSKTNSKETTCTIFAY